ncbi:MAG: beta-ketoacyl synthase [Gammaproteobacteria bacterium]|nr:beta-ketoacyl synthase [Gammaproteobacteria bacterium]
MARLPIIAGFGGISSAGRSSLHHGYRRLVIDRLSSQHASATLQGLATMMGLLKHDQAGWCDPEGNAVDLELYLNSISDQILAGTLIRKLENNLFEPGKVPFNKRISLSGIDDQPVEFLLSRKQVPNPLPEGWQISAEPGHDKKVRVLVRDNLDVLLTCQRQAEVNTAGQLPSGFDPEKLYPSRNHPRALQLTVFGASDAINSLGIDWQMVRDKVAADQIAVYAGSCFGQLDYNGFGGLLQARLLGKKPTSKQLPLGFAEMPSDFINAYLLGNLGGNGTNVAACATFLYNLRQGVRDIQTGSHRVVIVGTSEAPLTPEIFDGFTTMGALADDNKLRLLDGLAATEHPAYGRACRPFGNNAGFTMAESAQFVVLLDDELALELGANIYGAVNEVFVAADGYKKSIAGPGAGNYLTMAKAVAATRNIVGDKALREKTYVQAHGTGTPQNRTTESHILSQVAQTFGMTDWPVTAIKAYLGHSIATSAGDQLAASLGIWEHGVIPGITTTNEIADDVSTDGLDILLQHREVAPDALEAVFINSKGFGGNNASASVLSPERTRQMLASKHGSRALTDYLQRREATLEKIKGYDDSACAGRFETIYQFGENVLDWNDIEMQTKSMKLKGLKQAVNLDIPNNYAEYQN